MPATGNNRNLYELSIRIFADGFSFLVTEASSGDLMHREDVNGVTGDQAAKELADMFRSPHIARYIYNNVRAIAESDSTTMPLDEVPNQDLEVVYKTVFVNADLTANSLCYATQPRTGTAELFTIPKAMHLAIMEAHPNAVLTCQQACLLDHLVQFSQSQDSGSILTFAHIVRGKLFVNVIQHNKLMFANSFPVDDIQNALFFFLSVWKELQLDARADVCYVSGNKQLSAQLSQLISRYILHLERIDIADIALC